MIIDVHGHLGNINFAPFWQADATALDEYCRKAGVDWLCISSSKAIMYDVREGNADLGKGHCRKVSTCSAMSLLIPFSRNPAKTCSCSKKIPSFEE